MQEKRQCWGAQLGDVRQKGIRGVYVGGWRSSGNPLNNLLGIFHIQSVIFMNFDSRPFIVNPGIDR